MTEDVHKLWPHRWVTPKAKVMKSPVHGQPGASHFRLPWEKGLERRADKSVGIGRLDKLGGLIEEADFFPIALAADREAVRNHFTSKQFLVQRLAKMGYNAFYAILFCKQPQSIQCL